jgi:hypothetical protein
MVGVMYPEVQEPRARPSPSGSLASGVDGKAERALQTFGLPERIETHQARVAPGTTPTNAMPTRRPPVVTRTVLSRANGGGRGRRYGLAAPARICEAENSEHARSAGYVRLEIPTACV